MIPQQLCTHRICTPIRDFNGRLLNNSSGSCLQCVELSEGTILKVKEQISRKFTVDENCFCAELKKKKTAIMTNSMSVILFSLLLSFYLIYIYIYLFMKEMLNFYTNMANSRLIVKDSRII